jgi:hypothetical protein
MAHRWTGTPSFNVGGQIQTLTRPTNWTTLVQGNHYALFQGALADASGQLTFTPNANPSGQGGLSRWSAFQLQVSSVPEPATVLSMAFGVLTLLLLTRNRPGRRAAVAEAA